MTLIEALTVETIFGYFISVAIFAASFFVGALLAARHIDQRNRLLWRSVEEELNAPLDEDDAPTAPF